LAQKNDLTRLVEGIKKVHKIDIHEMKDPLSLVQEVHQCIKWNSEWFDLNRIVIICGGVKYVWLLCIQSDRF